MDSAAEPRSKLNDVLWCTIGQRVFGFGPHKLIGVELRGVGREPVRGQSWVPAQECRHVLALVNRPAIPEQFDRPAEMAQEVAQKHDDLRPSDVVGMQIHDACTSPRGSAPGTPDTAEMAA